MENELQEVTIDTIRSLRGMDKFYALNVRREWLKRQREQDMKEDRTIGYKIKRLWRKRQGYIIPLLLRRYILQVAGYMFSVDYYLRKDGELTESIYFRDYGYEKK